MKVKKKKRKKSLNNYVSDSLGLPKAVKLFGVYPESDQSL